MKHTPVLLNEVLEGLDLAASKNVIDCTLGDAGHAEAILERISPDGRVLGIDADPEALLRAQKFLLNFKGRAILVRDSFRHLKRLAEENNFSPVHAVLFDLGWSLPQLKERGRGFSFAQDEPLDMRYNPNKGETAAELINTASAEELTRVLRRFGEEEKAQQIARALVEARPVSHTSDVVSAMKKIYKSRGKIHPATKTFQALRIWTNNELEVLREALPQAVEILEPGGRLAVVSFHSLEDRIVKQFFKKTENIKIMTKRPIRPSDKEIAKNPAARSAKLRIAEKK